MEDISISGTTDVEEGEVAGSPMEIIVTLPNCDMIFTFTVIVIGTNGQYNTSSNEVRDYVFCTVPGPTDSTLSAGAIAGITIGSILFVILILLMVYLCMNWKYRDELKLWQWLTCTCCRRTKEDDNFYNSPPTSARRSDVIRGDTRPPVQPIRSISDLYARPDLEAKHTGRSKKKQDEDDDDGGFSDYGRRNEAHQMNAMEGQSHGGSSTVSYNRSNTAINQVGLPPVPNRQNYGPTAHQYNPRPYNNKAYDESSDSESNNSRNQPPRPLSRHNTQV